MELLGYDLLPEQAHDIKQRTRSFAEEQIEPNAEDYFQSGTYPTKIVEAARKEGLVAQEISSEYGGQDRSLSEVVAATEELFRADAGIGLAVMGQSFGTAIF